MNEETTKIYKIYSSMPISCQSKKVWIGKESIKLTDLGFPDFSNWNKGHFIYFKNIFKSSTNKLDI